MADVKVNQRRFKYYLGKIKKDAKKSKEQKSTIYNTEMFYKSRNEAYDDGRNEFYNDIR